MHRLLIAFSCLVLVSGCSQTSSNNAETSVPSTGGGSSGGVLSSLRAKADPEVLARIKAEEEARMEQNALNGGGLPADGGASLGTSATVGLPSVSNAPFAPAAESVSGGPIVTPADQSQVNTQPAAAIPNPFGWLMGGGAPAAPKQPEIAGYGGYGGGPSVPPPPPGGAIPGGLVPPPPAVSLSGTAQFAPPQNMSPYAGYNPYAQPAPQEAAAPARPGLF